MERKLCKNYVKIEKENLRMEKQMRKKKKNLC